MTNSCYFCADLLYIATKCISLYMYIFDNIMIAKTPCSVVWCFMADEMDTYSHLSAQCAEQGLWNCRASVRLSRHSAAAPRCGGFAAVGPAGGRYRSIAAARPARRSNCEQCRVVSGRRKLNTDLFWYGWSWLALFCCTTREWRHSWCQRSISNFNSVL